MNKQELLKEYKRQEDKMCLAQILDKIEVVNKTNKIEYTDFLDMYQIALVQNFIRKIQITNCNLYGGYENAERKIVVICPKNYTESMLQKNYNKMLNVIRIQLPEQEKGKYTHRNYLGGIVKLGLKREKVGDILVSDDGADIVTVKDFSNILKEQLPSLTRFESSKIEIIDIQQLKEKEVKVEEIKIIVPSLRMDNIVSDLARTSRSKAAQIINQERVFINGQCETKLSKQLKLNDIVTIRGKGRFIIKKFTGTTRSGRLVVLIEKYV